MQVGTQAQVSHHNSRSKKEQGHPGRRGETRHFAPSSLFSRLEKGPAHFVASHPHIKHDPVSTSALDLCALSFSVVVSPSLFLFHFLISPGHQHTHFKQEVCGLAEIGGAGCQHCGKLCCRAGEGPASAPKGWELAQLLTSVPFLQ